MGYKGYRRRRGGRHRSSRRYEGDTDTGPILGQANTAPGISKSPPVWSKSVLDSHGIVNQERTRTVHSSVSLISFICLAWTWNINMAWQMPMSIEFGIKCAALPACRTEMRLPRVLRELKQCYQTSVSVSLKVSCASRQGSLSLRWLFFTTDLKPDKLDV